MKRKANGAGLGVRFMKGAGAILALGASLGGGGCLGRPIDRIEPRTTAVEVDAVPQSAVNRIDLLLMIDNSTSMGDKQTVLAAAVPDLVNGLLHPPCVDGKGQPLPSSMQPKSPSDACPGEAARAFTVVEDVHIGIVTSSLGDYGNSAYFGGGACADGTRQNDQGHLVAYQPGGKLASSYEGDGFLAWDPAAKDEPPGITQISGSPGSLQTQLNDFVMGTGQTGCGYEAQLESWYRFLVDPAPYASIKVTYPNYVASSDAQGADLTDSKVVDQTVLKERADFLRSDSLLAIIMLSDENDCSVKHYSIYPIVVDARPAGDKNAPPPASAACTEKGPLDPCCYSCGDSSAPQGCPSKEEDPHCKPGSDYTTPDDSTDLRCWNTKQRFGFDALYPIERYSIALTQTMIPDPHAFGGNDGTDLKGSTPKVPNPIFSDLHVGDPTASHVVRDPKQVFLAGIVGVPWQDIAEDYEYETHGKPLTFKTAKQMSDPSIPVNGKTVSTWDVILGNPEAYVPPLDPHMIESIDSRSGTDPITHTALAPYSASRPPAPDADPINGHEWDPRAAMTVSDLDLQYACVFALPKPGTCSGGSDCDCDNPLDAPTSPLCEKDAQGNTDLQYRAKGYPGVRELQVIQAVGDQGIVGSICPVQLKDGGEGVSDYGYRPAIQGIVAQLKAALVGQCESAKLTPDKDGEVSCLVVEAVNTHGAPCTCDKSTGRSKETDAQAIDQIKEDEADEQDKWNCFCEIRQLSNKVPAGAEQLTACQTQYLGAADNDITDAQGHPVNGWCYVDPESEPNVNPDIVKQCPATEKRIVRFVGAAKPQNGATVFTTCSGDTSE